MDKNIKIPTDNIPLLDDLVFYLKRLCTECVIKIQKDADKYESEKMHVKAYRYLCAVDNSASFYLYSYRRNEMLDAGVPLDIIDKAYQDLKFVPSKAREILLRNKKQEIIDLYEEQNPYYKTLNGQPERYEQYIYLTPDQVPDEVDIENFDIPLHQYSDVECDLLYHYGIIDSLLQQYPDFKYLNYLGSKRISIYKARKASNFSLLYVPSDIPIEIVSRFKDKLALNRIYITNVVYSEAYEFKSEYYENFLCVLLIVLTMIDIIAEMPDMINKNEIFDLKMVRLIFENYDIEFFNDIPFHYQLSMIKNLHKLLKYKSTTRNIIDICSIFGFDDVRVFKYYILKERKTDEFGNYITVFDDDYNVDNSKTYDLKFIKVPIKENVSKYLNDPSKYIEYDELTRRDGLWDGGLDHDYIKNKILDMEFNHYYSKYLSVEVLNSVTKLSFQMSYFYNMLFDDNKVEENLLVKSNSISTSAEFRLVDLISYLYALGYRYKKVKDTIFTEQTKIITIMGFNFEQDMEVLQNNLAKRGYTFKDVGIEDWQNPSQILTVNQLTQVYLKNKEIYDHLVHEMNHAENKRIFDVYKMVFDSLMVVKNNRKMFEKPDGTIAETYTDFLRYRNPLLFKMLTDIDGIEDWEEKKVALTQQINNVVGDLSQYIETDELDNIFSIFPTVSRDAVRDYVREVIGFFKSYKIDIESVNTILKFDDKFSDKVRILDDIFVKYKFKISEDIPGHHGSDPDGPPWGGGSDFSGASDFIKHIWSVFSPKEKVSIEDFANIVAIIIRELYFSDKVDINELIDLDVSFKLEDTVNIEPIIEFMSKVRFEDYFDIFDYKRLISKLIEVTKVDIKDKAAIVVFRFKNLYLLEDEFYKDFIKSSSVTDYKDYTILNDNVLIKTL